MTPRRIEGAMRHLGAPADWDAEKNGPCGHLSILDMPVEGGGNVMISAWEPTPAEIEAINAGASVLLQVTGVIHPPVAVWVETSAQG